jgi:hypothetical protein
MSRGQMKQQAVRIEFFDEQAQAVTVAGTFNQWRTAPSVRLVVDGRKNGGSRRVVPSPGYAGPLRTIHVQMADRAPGCGSDD